MGPDRPRRRRCAVYTRKSSEEGLEQSFNSLDAQREACEAYIKSQAGDGWQLIRTHYDDGAYSGGTLERPALQRLLADIADRKVDTVVVYKVDRLTRSLADFAKIVDIFDAQGVTFVSVTQQFNTTTSIGRLTLNMLLSFAQFEREVTGERIRDKIAASKKKGMWMGGFVPLGYDAEDRSLVINDPEAETVRTVFRLYLELGNVRRVKESADRLGLVTKVRDTGDSRMRGGRPLSRGAIYKLLSNPIYIGRIAHKGETYEGLHAPIIDAETWKAAQATLAANAQERRAGSGAAEPSLLAGLLLDENGNRLSPSHAVKTGKRYRYYVSRPLITAAGAEREVGGFRIPAHEIETLVTNTLESLLLSSSRLFDVLELEGCSPNLVQRILARARRIGGVLRNSGGADTFATVRIVVASVTIAQAEIRVAISTVGLADLLGLKRARDDACEASNDRAQIWITVPAKLHRRGGGSRFIVCDDSIERERKPDAALMRVVGRAHDWFGRLATGDAQSAADIAREEKLTRSYVTRVVRLALLAPDLTEAILDGRQPPELTAECLVRCSRLPLAWGEQRRGLGFDRR